MPRYPTPATLVALLALASCGSPASTDVLQLSGLEPRQLEVGDRVEITSENLPAAADIRRIEVTLRGVLARPGRVACGAPVEVTLSDPPVGAQVTDLATGVSRDVTYAERTARTIEIAGARGLSFVMSEELLASLTRCPGERAPSNGAIDVPHATLALGTGRGVGEVTVRVYGLTSGRAVAGTLRGPTIDLLAPPTQRLGLEPGARRAAERALDFMGLVLATSHPTDGGLRVASVRPGSPAERAGVASNDVLARIDGATVLGVDDFRPAPGARIATLAVLRGEVLDERVVSLEGLTPDTPIDLAFAGGLLCVLALWLAFALAPRPAVVAWLASRLRLERTRGPRDARVVPALVCAAAASTLIAVPFGRAIATSEVDVGTLYAAAVVASVVAHGASRGRRTGGGVRAFVGSLGRLLRGALGRVPALVAIAAVVATAGSLRVRGIVASQGGAPWEWNAVRTPALFALFALFAVANAGAPASASSAPAAPRSGLARVADPLHLVLSAALAAVAFLGGWQLPGVAMAEQAASPSLQMAGAFVLLAKTWSCVFAVLWMRWAMPRLRPATLLGACWRHVVAVLVLASGASAGWILLAPRLPVAAASAASSVTFVLAALGAAWLVARRHVALNASARPVVPAVFPAHVARHDRPAPRR